MIYEVAAAVDHIVSLVQQVERTQPIASDALAGFASTLKDALEKRCQQCWKPAEPECGSALRSVAWQLHSAGEGADLDLLRAFASVIQTQSQESQLVRPNQHSVVALALQWLPQSFTLWIDPGCVAIRMGSGPGAGRSSYDFDLIKSGSASTSVHVIWGQMVAQPADREAPLLTVSSASRPIPIVKPTPTVAQPRYPTNLISNALPTTNVVAPRHSRTLSTASSASSFCGGLVRSVSYSSTSSLSTDATSLSGLDADADAESEACPSLCSPFSSLASTHCTPSSDLDRESVHDVTVGDTTARFAGVRLFADDLEQEDDAGDVTIGLAPMLGLELSKGVASAKTPLAASTPIKCNYTTHDNGNVGVLGGGVRLGGSTKNNNNSSASAPPPRHRQHSSSKSISHLQGGLHNQLLPAYMPRPAYQPMARQPHHMSAANYSAPLRTVPLPGAAPQQQQQQQQHHLAYQQHAYQHQQQQYHAPQPATAYARPSQLPAPYGYPAPVPQQPYSHCAPHLVVPFPLVDPSLIDAEADDTDPASGRRRVRSRGRRSRGRGAGRAARRQAAALRASELGTTDEFFDGEEDDEDGISRCSTPATSDYTSTACSSIYSSATSSPVKQLAKSGTVSKRASRTNLRAALAQKQSDMAFGQRLTAGLARLMA